MLKSARSAANLWMVWRGISRHGLPGCGGRRGLVLVAIAVVQLGALDAQATATRAARTSRKQRRTRIVVAIYVDRPAAFWSPPTDRREGGAAALNWGDITAQHKGRPLFSRELAERFLRAAFDRGGPPR